MKFLAFAASHRPGSYNKQLLECAISVAQNASASVTHIAYENLDMPMYNDHLVEQKNIPDQAKALASAVSGQHGLIIAAPEYNWSLPGSLKNIIDWTSRIAPDALSGKTALLLCATTSARGGIIGISHLRSVLESQGAFVFNRAFPLSKCHETLTPTGIKDEKSARLLETIVKDYIAFTAKITQ